MLSGVAQRWAHLLQPIRDLPSNWEIDVAKELEDYLIDLEQIHISVDGKTLNFAEAALVIQGSVSIYSKKVEHLYGLIFNSLENLTNQKKKKEGTKGGDKNDSNANADEEEPDNEPQLLPLDDIQEGRNINLSESSALDKDLLDSMNLAKAASALALSQSKGDDLPYQMMNCTIAPSGALVLGETADFLSMDEGESSQYLRRMSMAPGMNPLLESVPTLGSLIPQEEGVQEQDPRRSLLPGEVSALVEGSVGPEEGLPPVEYDSEGEHVEAFEMGMGMEHEPGAPLEGPKAGAKSLGGLREHSLGRSTKHSSISSNPWASLDPHSKGSLPEKPIQRAKCYRVPPKVSKEKSDKTSQQKQALPEKKQPDPFLVCLKYGGPCPRNYFLKAFFPEVQPSLLSSIKKRKAKNKKSVASKDPETVEMVEPEPEMAPQPIEILEQLNLPPVQEQEPEAQEEQHIPMDEGAISDEDLPPIPEMMQPNEDNNNEEVIESYEDLCRKHFEKYMKESENYLQESDLSKSVQNWKQRIGPIINEQENRPPFDIRVYAQKIIETFTEEEESNKTPKPISSFLAGQQHYEICRRFITALHLVNSENIKLSKKKNDLSVVLLSKKPPVDFESYLAPSVAEKHKKGNKNVEEDSQVFKKPTKKSKKRKASEVSLDEETVLSESNGKKKKAKKPAPPSQAETEKENAPQSQVY